MPTTGTIEDYIVCQIILPMHSKESCETASREGCHFMSQVYLHGACWVHLLSCFFTFPMTHCTMPSSRVGFVLPLLRFCGQQKASEVKQDQSFEGSYVRVLNERR
jgi:hypothetical protein